MATKINLQDQIKSRIKSKKLRRLLRGIYLAGKSPKSIMHELTALAIKHGTDKWGSHWYTPHYQRHFHPLRLKELNILEIGVGGYNDPNEGGESLRMWKEYFPNSNIFAIDIHDKSALQEDRITIYKGSQNDNEFLKQVADEIGRIDIIIDDGSHINEHVINTFNFLFPLLEENGLYVVEDTQTSYWPDYGGDSYNLNNPNTMQNLFKSLIDSINYMEIAQKDYTPSYFDKNITEIHFYHNMVFIQKGNNKETSTETGEHTY